MSGEKTELPTQKKLRDSAKKGESYKSRDIIAAFILGAGILFMTTLSFSEIGTIFKDFAIRGNNISPDYAGAKILQLFLELTIPFVFVCIAATVVPSLLQSKFALAFEAIKIDFASLDPISGFQKIFSLKTVKEFVKTLLYLLIFCAVSYMFYQEYRNVLYSLVNAQPSSIAVIWLEAGAMLMLLCLGAFMLIILLDSLVDYHLYIKELKMEKHEVKQEYKEQEGHPEVKHRRRELHQEILSQQVRNDIDQSNFILANPTHIAIGIYIDINVAPIPFISVLEKNVRALAVIAYAEKRGKIVVRDIPVARRLFKKSKVYSFMPLDEIEPIVRIIEWLLQVESSHIEEITQAEEEASAEKSPDEEAKKSNKQDETNSTTANTNQKQAPPSP